jgi:hypothetical protein
MKAMLSRRPSAAMVVAPRRAVVCRRGRLSGAPAAGGSVRTHGDRVSRQATHARANVPG